MAQCVSGRWENTLVTFGLAFYWEGPKPVSGKEDKAVHRGRSACQ